MQVNATYHNGRLVLPPDIELVKECFTVIVNFPPEVVRRKDAGTKKNFSIRSQVEAIVGSRDRREPQAQVDCRKAWHEHLEEKYLGK